MKTKYLPAIVLTAAALAFNFRAVADDGEGDTNECDIQGMEVMEGFVVLTPTNNAPTNATGVAKIDSDNEDGDESASIELRTSDLNPGDYSLSVTLQSTGSNVFIGTFTVSSNECCGDQDDQGDDDNQGDQEDSFRFGQWDGQWGGFTNCPSFTNMTFTNCFSNWNGWCGFGNWGSWCNSGNTNSCSNTNQPGTCSRDHFDLPAGVNPTDIGEILVSDTNDVVLEGDVTNPVAGTVINIQATVQLKPGADSSMSGAVQLTSTAQKGKWKHQFKLQASGATSHSTYKMNVNGKNGGAGKSTRSGQLKITKLPSHTSALRSLKLLDANGNEAASAHF